MQTPARSPCPPAARTERAGRRVARCRTGLASDRAIPARRDWTPDRDHRSFCDQLVLSIGFAVARSSHLLGLLIREHAPDDARYQLAERVVEHLEASGFQVDEAGEVLEGSRLRRYTGHLASRRLSEGRAGLYNRLPDCEARPFLASEPSVSPRPILSLQRSVDLA
jgi:hypothetical protein